MSKTFNISSLENFSEEEANILKKHGAVFQRLTSGERQPETEAQKRFVEVARGACNPMTIYERAWRKYLDQSKSKPPTKPKKECEESGKEVKNRDSMVEKILNPHNGPGKRKAQEGFGGSREDWKKNRNRGRYDGS